jgi:hypothetical protein
MASACCSFCPNTATQAGRARPNRVIGKPFQFFDHRKRSEERNDLLFVGIEPRGQARFRA